MHQSPAPQNMLESNPIKSMAKKRVYQVWKGSNRFFLGGRLIFGPDVRSLLLTIFLIIVPLASFCIWVARPLMHEFPYHLGVAIMVLAVLLTIFNLILLLLTSGRDPGIIPRNPQPPEPEEDYDISNSLTDWVGEQTPKWRLPRTKDVIVNGVAVKVKYCDTCMLYRPPRCSHCSICNNCVERFDHHCPWVGQCVGRRNYPFFFMFVFSTTLLCIYAFALSALHIKKVMEIESFSVWKALGRSPASIVLMAYSFIAVWFVGGLTCFHLYLMGTNQTTYENFRYRYDKKKNPYNHGIAHNFGEIFCTTIPPSKNKFRAKVQPGSSVTAAIQSAEPRDILYPSTRKAGSDIDMGTKLGWASMIDAEIIQELQERINAGSGVVIDMKEKHEDTFPYGFDHAFINEPGESRDGGDSWASSWIQKNENLDTSTGTRLHGSNRNEDDPLNR